MPVIKRTAKAEEDLISIWLYISQNNPAAADRLLDEIEEACSLLANHPQLGPARVGVRSSLLTLQAARRSCSSTRLRVRWVLARTHSWTERDLIESAGRQVFGPGRPVPSQKQLDAGLTSPRRFGLGFQLIAGRRMVGGFGCYHHQPVTR